MGKEIRRILFAVVVGILVILGMTGLFAWLVLRETIDMIHMDLMTAGILIAGSGSSAMACGRGEGSAGRIVCAECGQVLFLCLVNLAVYDGMFFEGLFPCVLVIGGTAGAVVLARAGKHPQRYRGSRTSKRAMGKLNKKYGR